mmetsp:Transcript_95996/g.200528  ORF Transcript_95996/g.200528 Transcript_95996/m.200528 type:complete len:141 (-) Transcript_95996:335-757(-)
MGLPCSKEDELRKQITELKDQLKVARQHINALEVREQERLSQIDEQDSETGGPRLLSSITGTIAVASKFGRKMSKDMSAQSSGASTMRSKPSMMQSLSSDMSKSSSRRAVATAHSGFPDHEQDPPRKTKDLISRSTLGHY